MAERAVILLSGGMDSAVVLAEMRHRGFECLTLAFDYGQRHRVELLAAERVAASLGAIEHRVASIDLRAFGGSALTSEISVPKNRPFDSSAGGGAAHPPSEQIPVTYVPARNTIFLAHALAMAETRGARHIAIGVNAIDYSGYPDCRPEFISAFEALANLATREGVTACAQGGCWLTLHAPLLRLSKADIVKRGTELGVDFSLTFSCYDPIPDLAAKPYGVRACAHCDACRLREKGFSDAESVGAAFRTG